MTTIKLKELLYFVSTYDLDIIVREYDPNIKESKEIWVGNYRDRFDFKTYEIDELEVFDIRATYKVETTEYFGCTVRPLLKITLIVDRK